MYSAVEAKWNPLVVPEPSVMEISGGTIYNPSATASWSKTLEGMAAKTLGFSEANERKNEALPWIQGPRAKPPPRQIFLRWVDRSFDSGATLTNTFNRLVQFGWNLPEIIKGYDSITLFSCNVNMAWFHNFGSYLGIQLNADSNLLNSDMITSADGSNAGSSKVVSPTWLLPNANGAGTIDVSNMSNMGSPDPRNSAWAANIRGKSFGSLSVTLCDEGLAPLIYVGSTPGTAYYFYLVLLLQ